MSTETTQSRQEAIALFREQGGTLRTSEAQRLGIHPRTLYALRDAGVLEQLSRGLYRLSEMPPLVHPDLVTVALRVPQSVTCLLSALIYHELTTQIPHAVHFCIGGRGGTTESLSFIESMAKQLGQSLPGFTEKLVKA